MLVFDFTDDFFDEVFNRHQTFGAGIFVENDGQMRARPAHFVEQRENTHILRDEARLTNKGFQAFGRLFTRCKNGEHVLDMDHADDAIQRLPIDGQAAVPMFGEGRDAISKASAFVNGDNVAAGHHDVVNPVFAKMQKVTQHSALNRGQVTVIIRLVIIVAVFFVLGNCFFKLLTQRRFVIAAKKHRFQPLPYSSVVIVVGCGFRTAKTVTLGHNGSVLASFWLNYASYGL